MATRRKRRTYKKRKAKTFVLSKYNIGIGLIILGFLYFFSLFLAKDSPVFNILTEYASIAFGNIGITIFFILAIICGLVVLFRGYLMQTVIKQSVLLMLFISAIINFPIIDSELSLSSDVSRFSEL